MSPSSPHHRHRAAFSYATSYPRPCPAPVHFPHPFSTPSLPSKHSMPVAFHPPRRSWPRRALRGPEVLLLTHACVACGHVACRYALTHLCVACGRIFKQPRPSLACAVVKVLIPFNVRDIECRRDGAGCGDMRRGSAARGGGRRGGAVRGDRARRSGVCLATRVDYPSSLPGSVLGSLAVRCGVVGGAVVRDVAARDAVVRARSGDATPWDARRRDATPRDATPRGTTRLYNIMY